jgi:hypothetical protein
MKATWTLDTRTHSKWERLVQENRHKPIPKDRQRRNVDRKGINISKERVWRTFVACQITTQQRSGANSPVAAFMKSDSRALSLSACSASRKLTGLLEAEFESFRFGSKNAENLTQILHYLSDGGWQVLMPHLKAIRRDPVAQKERLAVQHLSSGVYPGLGPKQSRNFLQALGLSRFEVPIDSRVLSVMRELGSNFVPSPKGLGDEVVYRFVQDGLQQISQSLGIYPCMLDACIFASIED